MVKPEHNPSDRFEVKKWREVISKILDNLLHPNGGIKVESLSDADAKPNSIYFSTTSNKLSYKNASGTVTALY